MSCHLVNALEGFIEIPQSSNDTGLGQVSKTMDGGDGFSHRYTYR